MGAEKTELEGLLWGSLLSNRKNKAAASEMGPAARRAGFEGGA